METRDPLARGLFGLGCALIIGAPLLAVAVSCTAQDSQGGPQAPRTTAPTHAPAGRTAAPHADAQPPVRKGVSPPARPNRFTPQHPAARPGGPPPARPR